MLSGAERPTSPRLPVPGTESEQRRAPRQPERRCIATGQVRPKAQLLRFVVGPDDQLVFDLGGRLPGRGLWIAPSREHLTRARAKGLFAKAAGKALRIPEDLEEFVGLALRRHCLELLGLARRAGLVTSGFEKVRARLRAGEAGLLLQAVDSAEGGRNKLAGLARAALPGLPVVELFEAEELGSACGREPIVHLLMAPGGMTERVKSEIVRLQAFLATAESAKSPAQGPRRRS